jgi:SNF family Na+-dependent transporter
MKKALFYVFLVIFALTALVALLGVIGAVNVKEPYLGRLFAVLILQVAGAVIGLYKKTNFWEEHLDRNPLTYHPTKDAEKVIAPL